MSIARAVATLGPIGFCLAPGTLATLATVPFIVARAFYLPMAVEYELLVLCVVSFCAWFIIRQALTTFPYETDPSAIVLDEVVGCAIAFFAVPINSKAVVLGVLLFRFFDIVKPYFIKKCEELPGALGVLADDVAAGAVTMIILQVFSYRGLLS